MIVFHANNVAAFKGNHVFYMLRPHQYASFKISATSAAAPGRIMSSLARYGGLAAKGGIAGTGGGLAN